jgi:DNA ligase-1
MKLPTLYKRTTTGATQSWEIEIEEDKFRTISGQLDGKKITNNWTTCEGKNLGKANATTGEEQALKEAEAKHQKKRDKGYRLDIDNIDVKKFYAPMLAQDFKNKLRRKEVMTEIGSEKDNTTGYGNAVFSQPKLDGIRCIAMREGLFTRTGKPITAVPHIHEALEPFFELYPHATLDGELYNHAYKDDFNKIIHLVRKQNLTEEHLAESKKMIQYHIYDAPVIGKHNPFRKGGCYTEKDLFSDRTSVLDAQFANLGIDGRSLHGEPNPLVIVETTEVNSREHLDELYADYVEVGYEGQMIRLDAPYENKRSSKLLKRKEFVDEEYEILGYDEGTGNREGTVKHFKFKNKDGRKFNSNVKGTFEYMAELLERGDELIGKQATVKYFNLTPDGVPRFPYVIGIRDYE